MTLDEVYDRAESLTIRQEADGTLRHVSGWPEYAVFDVFAMERAKPDVVTFEGHITVTLADGGAVYAVLGFKNGTMVCCLADSKAALTAGRNSDEQEQAR